VFTAFPFIVPTFLGIGWINIPYYDLSTLVAAEAGVLLIIYIMWLCFRYKTHVFLFQGWEELYPSPVVGSRLGSSSAGPGISEVERVQLPSHSRHLLWLITIFAVAVQCSASLIQNVPALTELTSLSRPFIGAVLLPVITSLSNCAKTCLIAKANRVELVLHLTVETALAMVFLNLPGLTFASMILGHGALLNRNSFLSSLMFVSVLTTAFLIKDGVFYYIKGCMALALYVMVSVEMGDHRLMLLQISHHRHGDVYVS
jgi:calcium/proton exchanger cax